MKKTITALALALTLSTSIFAADGIIVAGRSAEPTAGCTQSKDGIIVAGRDGIIVAGIVGIIVAGMTGINVDTTPSTCDSARDGIIVSD